MRRRRQEVHLDAVGVDQVRVELLQPAPEPGDVIPPDPRRPQPAPQHQPEPCAARAAVAEAGQLGIERQHFRRDPEAPRPVEQGAVRRGQQGEVRGGRRAPHLGHRREQTALAAAQHADGIEEDDAHVTPDRTDGTERTKRIYLDGFRQRDHFPPWPASSQGPPRTGGTPVGSSRALTR